MRSGSKGNDWTSLAVRHRPQSCAQVPFRFWRFLLSPLLSPRPVTCLLARPHPNRLSLNALAGTGGLFQPICSTQQQTLREHRWGERTNGDLISRNPSLWEVRNHTLLPANTLAKVSQRDLLVPSFNSTAAKDRNASTRTPAHTLPLSPPHTGTHTRTRSQGSDRRIYSQDLQIAQRSEGSIFNAADVVVVQLPVGKQGDSMKAEWGQCRGAGRPGPPERLSLHPLQALLVPVRSSRRASLSATLLSLLSV